MKKRLKVWSILLVYILITIFSPLSAFAEESSFEELPEDYSAPIAEEEQDYDEIGEPADTEFEEEWNLMQTDEESYHELMEEKGYVYLTEGEKQQMVEANPEANIDISQIPDYYIPEQENSGVSTYALGGTYTDDFQTLTLVGKSSTSNDFKKIAENADIRLIGDNPNNYFGFQGGCFDGTYYYFCFLEKNSGGTQVDSRIVKGYFQADGTFNLVATIRGLKNTLHHVNDMTYNKDTEELVVVCCEGHHNELYTISVSQFNNSATANSFERHLLPCMINAIDYNSTRSQYVARLSGPSDGFVILDPDFHVVKTFGYSSSGSEYWATQGICVDNLYVYSLSYKINTYAIDTNHGERTYEKDHTDEIENRLRIFDWNGNLIKSYDFYVDKHLDEQNPDKYQYEAEHIFIADDRIMIGFACMKSKTEREFSFVDLSPWTYHLQFVPEGTEGNYIDSDDKYIIESDNVCAVMFRDVATPLRKFRVSVQNKEFLGWTAYRVETGEWLYGDANRANSAWYLPGQQPAGYIKYVYTDKQPVARTGAPGGHVLMCAQWKDSSTFTVSYMKNGGSGTMTDQIVTHGTATALKANTFTKENRNFVGWNAYWSEKNCWYYLKEDGTKGWYKEGYEPRGAKKYTYSDGQSVAQTVHKGNHVYMYALWNEYYIQYALNQEESTPQNKMINFYDILEMHTGKYETGVVNDILIFDVPQEYVSGSGYVLAENQYLTGYNIYRKEKDMWMYINGSTKKWFSFGEATSGYNLYKRSATTTEVYLGATALPGEHIILEAVWADSSSKTSSCQRSGLND